MKNLDNNSLLQLVRSYEEKGTAWHHHFLAKPCAFNESGQFRIIVENEETGEIFHADFEEKPLQQLEQLENLFFKRR
jgi:hypothetical protein